MLVLSRKQNERIVFPNLGISVQVVRVSGKVVRLGIDAPRDVRVLRDEVADGSDDGEESSQMVARQLRHELRNRLNTASLGLQVLHRRLEQGETDDAESTIFKVFHELREIDATLQPSQTGRSDGNGKRNRRTLIVEDNENESELLAAYLRMSGYEVDTVSDGIKAISHLKLHGCPDAVLLDMCMPRLDGPKTITSIRREPGFEGVKLLAVSGADRRELGVELGPRGVDRWFDKPVNAKELVSELSRQLDEVYVSA